MNSSAGPIVGRRRAPARRAWQGVALAAAVLVALLPVAGAGAAEGPTLELSATTGLDPEGQTITVTGSGFDPAANVGTRPPLAGQPSGVYVVFGRFADSWRPSQGAPSSARQVITQVWAVPQAAYELLNPLGTNPEIVLLHPDGTFTAEVEVREAEGTGAYAIATYPGSGAVNADQEVLVPVSFGAPSTTTTTTEPTESTTTTTEATTTTTTTAPTTTAPSTTTTVAPPKGSGSRTGEGANGQKVTVTPADDLDPAGATIRVQGTGFDTNLGIYVGLCVDQGPGAAPSPCVGGVDMEGEGSSSAWISSNPPSYATDLTIPFGPGGSFDVTLTVAAADEHVDCLAEGTSCVIATRADHTASTDRSADVRVPVHFAGQAPVGDRPSDPRPSVSLGASTVRAGEPLTVTGDGFLPGEQVQVWIHSDPVLVGVTTAGADGQVSHTFVVPADLPPGVHHVELRGVTSGRSVRSASLTVLAADPAAAGADVADERADAGAAGLAFTGGGAALAGPGAALLLVGAALVLITRRNDRQGANR